MYYWCESKKETLEKLEILKDLGIEVGSLMSRGDHHCMFMDGRRIEGYGSKRENCVSWIEFVQHSLKQTGKTMNFYVKTSNEYVRDVLFNLAQKAGYNLGEKRKTFLAVSFQPAGKLCHNVDTFNGWEKNYILVDIEGAVTLFQKKELPLIATYKPEVTKGFVKLGCQTLSTGQVKAILERMKPISVDWENLVFEGESIRFRGHNITKAQVEQILKEME